MTAKSRSANKLVSIVEIAKRELLSKGVKCFQYNVLSSQMIEIERKTKVPVDSVDAGAAKQGDEESDDTFEVMDSGNGTGPKKRSVPIMTTYLSSSPVKELKDYG